MPRALLSVSDKTGIVALARGLAAHGFELVSTGGTARALTEAGLQVTSVSDVTGVPELMDGRVKTLHPNIHGGILARRANAEDLHALARLGIESIDVVVVNLYPFAETAATPGVTFDDLIEQIDIGGPSMVRAAAKNFRDVLVVVDRHGAAAGRPIRASRQRGRCAPRVSRSRARKDPRSPVRRKPASEGGVVSTDGRGVRLQPCGPRRRDDPSGQ